MSLPSEDMVRRTIREITDQAKKTGRRPSVLAVARRLGLSNTTFRRNFPDIARQLGELRRTAHSLEVAGSTAAQHYLTLQERNARLRQDKQTLEEHLQLAAANVMRLTLENRQLRRELEAATKVTRIEPDRH